MKIINEFVKELNEKVKAEGIEVMFNINNDLFYISFENGDEHIRDSIFGVLEEIEKYS